MNETKPRTWGLLAVILLGVLAVVVAARAVKTLSSRKTQAFEQESRSRAAVVAAGPPVTVISLAQAPAETTITLIGETHPFLSTTVYAKVSGYLREIRVDKGDSVKANEVIGVIESPELDHQHESAVADAANKRINADRAAELVKKDMISRQDADQAVTEAKMAEENVNALATMRSYELLRAPFDGVVTARFADPGALLQNAANAQTSALPVVKVAQINTLRIYVYVPQSDAPFVHAGLAATITLPDRPGLKMAATITRTTGELDPKTRTLLTEIDFDNRDRAILPGSFVNVTLHLRATVYQQIPAQALVFRGEKPFVAMIGPDHRVKLAPVTVADDDGQNVRIVERLPKDALIAVDIGQSIVEGELVQPVQAH